MTTITEQGRINVLNIQETVMSLGGDMTNGKGDTPNTVRRDYLRFLLAGLNLVLERLLGFSFS